MHKRLACLIVLALVAAVCGGCVVGVYSKQDYGPGTAIVGVTVDQTLEEVVKAIGAPDKVLEIGDTTLLVYTQYEGMQVLGLYGSVKKKDMVIVMKGGTVVSAPVMVAKGEAMTVLGFIPTPVMGPALNKQE
jgi:hypothetical protein